MSKKETLELMDFAILAMRQARVYYLAEDMGLIKQDAEYGKWINFCMEQPKRNGYYLTLHKRTHNGINVWLKSHTFYNAKTREWTHDIGDPDCWLDEPPTPEVNNYD